jgi:hypothetical protein
MKSEEEHGNQRTNIWTARALHQQGSHQLAHGVTGMLEDVSFKSRRIADTKANQCTMERGKVPTEIYAEICTIKMQEVHLLPVAIAGEWRISEEKESLADIDLNAKLVRSLW